MDRDGKCRWCRAGVGGGNQQSDKGLRRMETREIRCAACFVGPAMRVEQLLCFGKELTRFFKKRGALRLSLYNQISEVGFETVDSSGYFSNFVSKIEKPLRFMLSPKTAKIRLTTFKMNSLS